MATNVEQYFEPGSVIRLADIRELREFEDILAARIDPEMRATQQQAWDARGNVDTLIRPEKYNGSLRDIELSVMEEPYEQLITATEAGWMFGSGKHRYSGRIHERISELGKQTIAQYIGFDLLCDARSSGKGVIGQIQTKLWYLPSKQYVETTGQFAKPVRMTSAYGGRTVHRVVAVPRYEKERFIQFDEAAKRVGFTVLRDAMYPVAQSKRPLRDD